MTRIEKETGSTSFKTADQLVACLTGGEELIAVCPGLVIVSPIPAEVIQTPTKTEKKKSSNTAIMIIGCIILGLVLAASEALSIDLETILGILAIAIILILFLAGTRMRPNAFILTADNAFIINGVSYDKPTNCYHFSFALCIPREEVKKHSWSATLRTLNLKLPGGFEVKIQQGKYVNKTKYYRMNVVDIVELNKILP